MGFSLKNLFFSRKKLSEGGRGMKHDEPFLSFDKDLPNGIKRVVIVKTDLITKHLFIVNQNDVVVALKTYDFSKHTNQKNITKILGSLLDKTDEIYYNGVIRFLSSKDISETHPISAFLREHTTGNEKETEHSLLFLLLKSREGDITSITQEDLKFIRQRSEEISKIPLLRKIFRLSIIEQELLSKKPILNILSDATGLSEGIIISLIKTDAYLDIQNCDEYRTFTNPEYFYVRDSSFRVYNPNGILYLQDSHKRYLPQNKEQLNLLTVMTEILKMRDGEINKECLEQELNKIGGEKGPYYNAGKYSGLNLNMIHDFLAHVRQQLIVPAQMLKAFQETQGRECLRVSIPQKGGVNVERIKSIKEARRRILSSYSVSGLMKAALLWHDKIHEFGDKTNKILTHKSPKGQWGQALGDVILSDGLTVLELNSQLLLNTEGRAQGHCVGGYRPIILDTSEGVNVVFSIRRGETILSTVQVKGTKMKDGYDWKVIQNYAENNGDPPPETGRACEELCGLLKENTVEEIKEYTDDLTRYSRFIKSDRTLYWDIGFDPFNEEHVRNCYEVLRPLLPKRIRNMGFEGFMNGEEVKNGARSYLAIPEEGEDNGPPDQELRNEIFYAEPKKEAQQERKLETGLEMSI